MTDPVSATSTSTSTSASNRGVKRGLPTSGLRQAEASAGKLWEVARRSQVAKQVFATALGMTSTAGSSFRTRMAVLNGFGLIKADESQVGLSDLGITLLASVQPEEQRSARREAVLKLKAYRDIVETFEGTELPPRATLTAKLKFEYGKTDEFAGQAAEALVDSLNYAEMLDARDVVHKAGALQGEEGREESALGELTPAEDDAASAEMELAFSQAEAEKEEEEQSDETADSDRVPPFVVPAVGQPSLTSDVGVAVTLDLSNFRANEVIEILQALGLARRV